MGYKAAVLIVVAIAAHAAEVGSESVWKDGPRVVPEIAKACDNADKFPACFAAQMANRAPAPVAAFAKAMHNEAWMRAFRDTGRVDVAWVVYQFRANENDTWLFVNGSPALFDPDNFKRLEGATRNDPGWSRVVQRYPRAMLFPGDRSSSTGPLVIDYPDGSQEFIADYQVMNGCHACEVLGTAFVSFDFSPKGKFTGARFLGFEKDRIWPLHTRTGQRFTLMLGCDPGVPCEWKEEQPPADNILRATDAKSQAITYDVTGAGTTQTTLKRNEPNATLVVRIDSAPGLRR